MNRLIAIAHKELIQLRRDRLTLAMTAVMPVMQLLLFGYAINTDVRHMPTVVFDQDHTAAARDISQRLVATGYYDVIGQVHSYDEIARTMRSGQARVALVIPPGFGTAVHLGRVANVQLVVDGSDPQTVGSATNTAASMAAAPSSRSLAGTTNVRAGPISITPSIWFNPEGLTAVYVVPGLIGVLLTMTMVMLTAMAIARERERGTLEALIVSPAGRVEIVVGKIIPYIGIGYVQISLILLAGRVIFDVPLVGSLPLLYLLSSLFIAASLAVGLLFSTIARTQQQAMQMSFFFLLPNILLSGFMFPFEAMPAPARALSQALPLTHFMRIVRRILLQGATMPEVEVEVAWLAALMTAITVVASLRFRKKLI